MNKKILLFFPLALLLTTYLSNQNHHQFLEVDAEVVLNEKDKVRLPTFAFGKDSKTSMTFTWSTTNYTNSYVHIVEEGQDFTDENIKSYKGTLEKSKVSGDDAFIHRVYVDNLDADTEYLFKIGDPNLHMSEVGSFKTSSNQNKNISFMHISDPQGTTEADYRSFNKLLKTSTSNFDYDFIALTGDIVNNSWADHSPIIDQWEWALTDQFDILRNYPLMTVSGNHEAAKYDFSSRFTFESEQQSLETGIYYSYTYEGVYFLGLNTNDSLDEEPGSGLSEQQMNFIRNDLELNKNAPWKIVMLHKGLFDGGSHASNMAEGQDYDIEYFRNELAPLFNEYNVDLVLQGHDHLYSKSYPIKSEINQNNVSHTPLKNLLVETVNDTNYVYHPNAPIYLNSGSASGSKYYHPNGTSEMMDMIETCENPQTKLFTNIEIDQEEGLLTFKTYKQENDTYELYQSYGINKGERLTSDSEVPVPPSIEEPSESNNLGLILGLSIGGGSTLVIASILVIVMLLRKKRGK